MGCETTSTTTIPFGEGSVTVTHTTREIREKFGATYMPFIHDEEVKVKVEIHGYSANLQAVGPQNLTFRDDKPTLPMSLEEAFARLYWEAYKKGKEDAENGR